MSRAQLSLGPRRPTERSFASLRRSLPYPALIALLLLLVPNRSAHSAAGAGAPSAIRYVLTTHLNGADSYLGVEIDVTVGGPGSVSFQMPVWAPGDYHVQNFQRHLLGVHAFRRSPDGDESLPMRAVDPNTWEVRVPSAGMFTVAYRLHETPPGFFSENVQLRADHVYVNGPSALMYVVGSKELPADIDVHAPPGWLTVMPLPIERAAEHDKLFGPADYDTLADSPILMAEQEHYVVRTFESGGKTFRLLLYGDIAESPNADDLARELSAIARAETKIMDGFPARDYVFFVEVGGRGGGLEHLNSCRIALPPNTDVPGVATFFAHEFFHLWNVKRIRPRALGPFDYIQPPRTRNLWFAEGVTEYYAHIAARRAGLMSEEAFLAHWRRAIRELTAMRTRVKVSADESSIRVWEARNSEGYGVSYYRLGELVGLCLDLKIRRVTDNRKSLDDVMRYLMRRYALPKPGYGEDDIRSAVSAVAGVDLSEFYDLLTRSTDAMPFSECLGYAGLDAETRPLPHATPEQIELRDSWMGAAPSN